jgi:hypothetical protein
MGPGTPHYGGALPRVCGGVQTNAPQLALTQVEEEEVPELKIKRVYVAGPITKGDQFINVRNAIIAGTKILEAGYHPFIPHLTCIWHMCCPGDYERWMAYDFTWIEVCDALIRLPGESSGSDREVLFAASKNIPVYFSVESFLNDMKASEQ